MALTDLLAGPVLEVAPRLLGATLTYGGVTVRLTEVEAYDGQGDPGSHAYRGMTPRNEVMFGPPGHLYVYFTYGMHHCCNVVCGAEGQPSAVLLRAGEVVDGLETARARRGRSTDRDLARGPGRLCQALGIDLSDNGIDLAATPASRTIPSTRSAPARGSACVSPRSGRGGSGSPATATVSRYVAAKPRPPGGAGPQR